jgi:hypothetical protein
MLALTGWWVLASMVGSLTGEHFALQHGKQDPERLTSS